MKGYLALVAQIVLWPCSFLAGVMLAASIQKFSNEPSFRGWIFGVYCVAFAFMFARWMRLF